MYKYDKFAEVLKNNPVIPVVAIQYAKDAVPLAETLVENGINIIEITLRTKEALDAIKNVIHSKVKIQVGAGTVFTTDQFKRLEDYGVNFVVSPGTTDELLGYAAVSNMAYLPGVMTSSDILKTYVSGFKFQKLFPAAIAGGIKAVQAYAGVYTDVKFCPTGGINADNFVEFLSQPNICAVGGTWIASKDDIINNSWSLIKERIEVIKGKFAQSNP